MMTLKGKSRMNKRDTRERIFVYVMLFYPLLHFAIFYVGINFNSILLSFKQFDTQTVEYTFLSFHDLFKNFIDFAQDIVKDPRLTTGFKNSTILYAVGLFVSTPLNILFAYFIYRKIPFHKVFKDILFMPAMISSIIMVMIFKYFLEYAMPQIAAAFGNDNPVQLLTNEATAFPMMIVFGLWSGFGGTLLLYANSMSKIPDSLIEYGRLEGMNAWQELTRLVLPFIYPTLTTFLVVGIADFFIAQGPLYMFYGESAPHYTTTIGYFMFTKVFRSDSSMIDFPYAAAGGLMFTLVAAPFTLFARWMFERVGPDVQY